MSPTYSPMPLNNQAEMETVELSPPQNVQPTVAQPMDPQRPHPETEADKVNLRGGRSETCPGRFCFIIPCPFPCDFCII